jgi:tetratricopeptide (TPR) repeat protein
VRRLIGWYLNGAVAAEDRVMPQRGMRQRLFPDVRVDPTHPASADPPAWLWAERSALRDVVLLAHQRGDAATVIRLCVVLWSLYEPTKSFDDLLATHRLALRDARAVGHRAARALIMVQLSFAHLHLGQPEHAVVLAEGAVAQAQAAADVAMLATALESAGLAALASGRPERATALLARNLSIAQQIGDPRRIALACLHLAKAVDAVEALRLLARALRLFRELPELEERNVAKVLTWQGRALDALGDLDGARTHLTEALELFGSTNRVFDTAQVLDDLGGLAARAGDTATARQHYRSALKLYEENGFLADAVVCQQRLADLT